MLLSREVPRPYWVIAASMVVAQCVYIRDAIAVALRHEPGTVVEQRSSQGEFEKQLYEVQQTNPSIDTIVEKCERR